MVQQTHPDSFYMSMALTLARRGLGQVWPNPAVGCVLVKDGVVVGRGWTQRGGRPHAETEALRRAGEAAKGATAYITLEPCAHHGQTPPCAEALLNAGIARAVIACTDPDERVAGKGLDILRQAGTRVDVGVLEDAAQQLNQGFISRIVRKRPYVTLKLATSLDGMVATRTGRSQWITGPMARQMGHLLRAQYDAIVTGSGTVLADDPQLTCRIAGMADASPVRVVLDSRGRTPATLKMFKDAARFPVWLFTRRPEALADLNTEGVEVISLPAAMDSAMDGGLDLESVLTTLAERGITRLLVEAGSGLNGSFLKAGLVDEIAWFRGPGVIGGDGLPVFAALGITELDHQKHFVRVTSRQMGEDILESWRATA